MPEKISIMRDSGETLNSNVVALFTIPDTGKQYIITTENAVDPHGLTVLHVSEIVEDRLKKIATDEEWSSIKTIMRAIISGNVGSYTFIPKITTAKADIQYSRDISVSAAASKQIIDSYLASNPSSDGGVSAAPAVDTDEITPGISEVVATPAPVADSAPVNVGNAVTNIPADAAISQPAAPATPAVPVEEVKTEATVVEPTPVKVEEEPKKEEAAVKEEVKQDAPASVVNVQTPVVAYVDPSFQQLLTSDYNQILMHVQSINNNINQIAAMPALNYQPSYSTNPNGTPNFNPNATVDEIIMGSTEVFNEGVKNLVATITEKIYRDLYQREAELAKREEVLLEREKMVNEQLSQLNSKIADKPAEPAPAPVVEAAAPVAEAPAPVVEASAPATPAAPAPAVEAPAPQVEAPAPVVVTEEVQPAVEQPVVNVVQAPVKVEAEAAPVEGPVIVEEHKAESTVPAQQNTAPVAEPAPVQTAPAPAAPTPEVGTPVVNAIPQPVQTVEIV